MPRTQRTNHGGGSTRPRAPWPQLHTVLPIKDKQQWKVRFFRVFQSRLPLPLWHTISQDVNTMPLPPLIQKRLPANPNAGSRGRPEPVWGRSHQ